jgi:hypothetical protein
MDMVQKHGAMIKSPNGYAPEDSTFRISPLSLIKMKYD